MEFKYCRFQFDLVYTGYGENREHGFTIRAFGLPDVKFNEHEMGSFIAALVNAKGILQSTELIELASDVICERSTGETFELVVTKVCNKSKIRLYGFDEKDYRNPVLTHDIRIEEDDDVFELLKLFMQYVTKNRLGEVEIKIG